MNKIILLFILFAVGCNSQSNKKDTSDENNTDSNLITENNDAPAANISGCYAFNMKKDSALLKLNISGTNVTGELSYHLYEKDNNSGTINGSLHDSLIIADYTFQSEGRASVRQVVFKMNNDMLVEGYGDIKMKGDTAQFKDVSLLKFENDRPFLKTSCE
ncbi:MAG: hypothetical protein M3015_11180 [Bacteroidota bacterium]|nr:hypothetical protein [Bacteroidota bacterium]